MSTTPVTRPIAVTAKTAPLRPSSAPEPFATRLTLRQKRPLGDLFGLKNFGVNLTTILPGGVSAMRHAHSAQDELVYVLEGCLQLVTDEGETELTPGMCAGFRAGSGNAHHLVNRTSSPATILEIGDRTAGDIGTYPDDDLQAVQADGCWRFLHKDGTPY